MNKLEEISILFIAKKYRIMQMLRKRLHHDEGQQLTCLLGIKGACVCM